MAHESESGLGMLYRRIVEQGTLSEPQGVPDPQFALPSTINWMRALAVVAINQPLDFSSARLFYGSTQKRAFSTHEENTIFEQLLFAVHQVSALEALRSVPKKSDVARIGIVAWYYGIYAAASAMVTAQDGSFQDDHSGTARSWDHQIAEKGLAMNPFELRVSTLVEKETKAQIAAYRNGNMSDLKSKPASVADARGAACAYLSGCAGGTSGKPRRTFAPPRNSGISMSQTFEAKRRGNFGINASRGRRSLFARSDPLPRQGELSGSTFSWLRTQH